MLHSTTCPHSLLQSGLDAPATGVGWAITGQGRARLFPARRIGNQSSAELHSAVSRICNPLSARKSGRLGEVECPAECNSAIQQIENLRYRKTSRPATIPGDTDPVRRFRGVRLAEDRRALSGPRRAGDRRARPAAFRCRTCFCNPFQGRFGTCWKLGVERHCFHPDLFVLSPLR